MADQDGFEIKGKFYPWAQQFRTLDPLLIRDVTGMTYKEFLAEWRRVILITEEGGGTDEDIDPVVMNGLVAVAFWQQHPTWSRDKVVRFFEQLNQEDLELVGGDDEDEEPGDNEDPLSAGVGDSTASDRSSPTQTTLNGTQESRSEPPSQASTGHQASAISSRA